MAMLAVNKSFNPHRAPAGHLAMCIGRIRSPVFYGFNPHREGRLYHCVSEQVPSSLTKEKLSSRVKVTKTNLLQGASPMYISLSTF